MRVGFVSRGEKSRSRGQPGWTCTVSAVRKNSHAVTPWHGGPEPAVYRTLRLDTFAWSSVPRHAGRAIPPRKRYGLRFHGHSSDLAGDGAHRTAVGGCECPAAEEHAAPDRGNRALFPGHHSGLGHRLAAAVARGVRRGSISGDSDNQLDDIGEGRRSAEGAHLRAAGICRLLQFDALPMLTPCVLLLCSAAGAPGDLYVAGADAEAEPGSAARGARIL